VGKMIGGAGKPLVLVEKTSGGVQGRGHQPVPSVTRCQERRGRLVGNSARGPRRASRQASRRLAPGGNFP
jgi:hypothetical protein